MTILPISFPNIRHKVYAGFGPRFAAGLVDAIVWIPVSFLFMYLDGLNRFSFCYTFLPSIMIAFFYEVYLVKRYGGTLGKLAMGLKVIKTNGNDVDWKQAFMRYLVSFIISIVGFIIELAAVRYVSDELFYSSSIWLRNGIIFHHSPFLKFWSLVMFFWTISEFFVLLTNDRKRAIHDYIAGTVVIKSIYFNAIKDYREGNVNPDTEQADNITGI